MCSVYLAWTKPGPANITESTLWTHLTTYTFDNDDDDADDEDDDHEEVHGHLRWTCQVL